MAETPVIVWDLPTDSQEIPSEDEPAPRWISAHPGDPAVC